MARNSVTRSMYQGRRDPRPWKPTWPPWAVICRVRVGRASQSTVRYGAAGIIGSSIAWMIRVGTVMVARNPMAELSA